jgi:hypothetical protein
MGTLLTTFNKRACGQAGPVKEAPHSHRAGSGEAGRRLVEWSSGRVVNW